MRILAIERDLKSIPIESKDGLLEEEALSVWKLQQKMIIREIYFHSHRSQAILILECENENEARLILQELPLVNLGYTDFDIYPLSAYTGYARLFKK